MESAVQLIETSELDPKLLVAIHRSGVCKAYYDLCQEHQTGYPDYGHKLNMKEVFSAASGRLSIGRLKGPGKGFGLLEPPSGTSLVFGILSTGHVEGEISIQYHERRIGGTLAMLCNAATQAVGLENPYYPAPKYASIEELIAVCQGLRDIFLDVCETISEFAKT